VNDDHSSDHPGRLDEEVAGALTSILGPLCARMWPGTFHGLEKLPAHDRYMVVANHSGMGSAELWSLLVTWYGRFGSSRPVAGMAHPGAFRVPVLQGILQGLGAVEATREGARKARLAGVPLLVFPGGDHEAMRPLWQARRVDFAGRKGWIRLAREHGLTIVPMCITGSHKTLPILMRSRALAWLTGLRLLGVRRAPLPALSFAAALGASRLVRASGGSGATRAAAACAALWATMMVPWIPASIGFHVLDAITPDEFVDPVHDDELYARVTSALQETLSRGA
jgi:1-acyl-sn-glycerol-3-phosphate acyltransferase